MKRLIEFALIFSMASAAASAAFAATAPAQPAPDPQSDAYVPADASTAYVYAWYPAFGWRWVVAPWVLGYGPHVWWGPLGPHHYRWYSRPWFRVRVAPAPVWRPHRHWRHRW